MLRPSKVSACGGFAPAASDTKMLALSFPAVRTKAMEFPSGATAGVESSAPDGGWVSGRNLPSASDRMASAADCRPDACTTTSDWPSRIQETEGEGCVSSPGAVQPGNLRSSLPPEAGMTTH